MLGKAVSAAAAGLGILALGVGASAVQFEACDGKSSSSDAPPTVQSRMNLGTCSQCRHVCQLDRQRACASCHRTCHANCDSDLCQFLPCGFCSSLHLVTHENSDLCIDAQKENIGCHACGRLGCWAAAPDCHTRCSRDHHVCGPSRPGEGCANCGRLCHENNSDVRCAYFQRMRGDVPWSANDQELRDTQDGTGGHVPHFSQVTWHFDGKTVRNSRKIVVDGVDYFVGRGDPGRAVNGEYNNCLIDSLRQTLGILSDRSAVRNDLLSEFGTAVGRAKVTASSYLDVEAHWQAILRSLFRHNTSGLSTACDTQAYCVVALYANSVGNGVVLGDLGAPNRLVVLNTSDVHFDPCLFL